MADETKPDTPAPKIASVLNIKFAPVKASAPSIQPAAPPKPATPKIESPKPQPVKPIETKKPAEQNTVPLSPFGKSEKKGSENPVVAPPAPPIDPPPPPPPLLPAVPVLVDPALPPVPVEPPPPPPHAEANKQPLASNAATNVDRCAERS